MCFLLNIQHIQGQDDQAADSSPDAAQVEASAVPAAKPADDQAVATKALTADELNAKFANELANLQKLRDQWGPIASQINQLDSQLKDQIKKDHPELYVYGADGFMSAENSSAIEDLKMQDPQRAELMKQLDDSAAPMNTLRDQINSEASAAGSTCQLRDQDKEFQVERC